MRLRVDITLMRVLQRLQHVEVLLVLTTPTDLCHLLSLAVTGCRWLSLAFAGCRWLSLAGAGLCWLVLAVAGWCAHFESRGADGNGQYRLLGSGQQVAEILTHRAQLLKVALVPADLLLDLPESQPAVAPA